MEILVEGELRSLWEQQVKELGEEGEHTSVAICLEIDKRLFQFINIQ